MGSDEQKPGKPDSFEEGEIPLAELVPSAELEEISIEPWKLSNFESEAEISPPKMDDNLYEKMKRELQPQLNQQAEILKKEAYDKAFQQGYEEGLLKGQKEGAKNGELEAKAELLQTLEPKIEQFESILTSLQSPYDEVEQKLYSELVDLALHIANTVINKELGEHKGWILEAIETAVESLPESNSVINVYLHPDDLAFLQISKPSIAESWQLHESANIKVGTCLVKQDYSTILNSWIARFDEVAQQISQETLITPDDSNSL